MTRGSARNAQVTERLEKLAIQRSRFARQPTTVARSIARVATAERPIFYTRVGRDAALGRAARRLLPQRALDTAFGLMQRL